MGQCAGKLGKEDGKKEGDAPAFTDIKAQADAATKGIEAHVDDKPTGPGAHASMQARRLARICLCHCCVRPCMDTAPHAMRVCAHWYLCVHIGTC